MDGVVDFMKQLNCWEFMKCGRERGGHNEAELGTCPAVTATEMNGANGGSNGGRACWVVAGTFCCGKTQGMYVYKQLHCDKCEFFKTVKAEEKDTYLKPKELLLRMRKNAEAHSHQPVAE